jgi:transglutaminase-like putative cysteine protease
MNRRKFLQMAGAASAGVAIPAVPSAFAMTPDAGKWRTFEVTTQVEILKPSGVTRVWVPAPLAQDTAYQKTLGNKFEAVGGTSGIASEPRYGGGIVWAEWPSGVTPILTHVGRFSTRDIAVDMSVIGDAKPESRETLAKFVQPTDYMPTDGAVKELSDDIVKGQRNDLNRARAIYDWIVDNTYRDPKTRGCGVGNIKFMVENQAWGGKCADLNALFVALARAQGIPARDVYGIRVADSALGYKSLGKSGDITKAQHCRAEFYLDGLGWIPVDPADVRKVILEEGGGKSPDDPMVLAARRRLFGSWEMNWLAYNFSHDITLPNSIRGPIAYLMYPQSETAEGRLDSLDPENFKYTISSKEV